MPRSRDGRRGGTRRQRRREELFDAEESRRRVARLHGHQSERLRFDARDSRDRRELFQELLFRRESFGFPSAERVSAHGRVRLEVEATAAHGALDLAFRLHRRQVLVEHLLRRRERGLIGIFAPFASPFASDGVESDAFRDFNGRHRLDRSRGGRRVSRSSFQRRAVDELGREVERRDARHAKS